MQRGQAPFVLQLHLNVKIHETVLVVATRQRKNLLAVAPDTVWLPVRGVPSRPIGRAWKVRASRRKSSARAARAHRIATSWVRNGTSRSATGLSRSRRVRLSIIGLGKCAGALETEYSGDSVSSLASPLLTACMPTLLASLRLVSRHIDRVDWCGVR